MAEHTACRCVGVSWLGWCLWLVYAPWLGASHAWVRALWPGACPMPAWDAVAQCLPLGRCCPMALAQPGKAPDAGATHNSVPAHPAPSPCASPANLQPGCDSLEKVHVAPHVISVPQRGFPGANSEIEAKLLLLSTKHLSHPSCQPEPRCHGCGFPRYPSLV